MELSEKLKWEKEVTGIDKYHEQGYRGQGITIMLHEADTGHALMSKQIIQSIAPEATVIEATVTSISTAERIIKWDWVIDGEVYSFDDMMKKFKPDIMSVSFKGSVCQEKDELMKKYIDSGELIVCNATGNDGTDGVLGPYRNVALNIGACSFMNNRKSDIQLMGYSGRDKDKLMVDYVGFLSTGTGTSAACPFVAAQIALYECKYGKVSQTEFQTLIYPFCKDLGDGGTDWEYGDGLIVLPDVPPTNEMYTDIKGHYARDAIIWGSRIGLVNGFDDGTFRPDEPVTRGQLMVILKRYWGRCGNE